MKVATYAQSPNVPFPKLPSLTLIWKKFKSMTQGNEIIQNVNRAMQDFTERVDLNSNREPRTSRLQILLLFLPLNEQLSLNC